MKKLIGAVKKYDSPKTRLFVGIGTAAVVAGGIGLAKLIKRRRMACSLQ